MKLHIDGTNYFNGKAPGFNSYFMYLLEGLNGSNFTKNNVVIVYILPCQKTYFQQFENLKIYTIHSSNNFYRIFWSIFIMQFKIKGFDKALYPANFAPFWLNKKFILVIHDLNYITYPSNFSFLEIKFRKLFLERSLKTAHRIVAISNFVKNELLNNFSVKSNVIYNPIDLIYPKINGDKSTLSFDKYILVPSSDAIHKNLHQCLDACTTFYNFNKEINFIFIGKWDRGIFIEKNQNSKNIKLLGYVDDQLKNSLFANSIAILMPSMYEGFGYPYFEALKYNKHLICCDIPIVKEFFIIDNKIIYPYDSQSILKALLNLDFNKTLVTNFTIRENIDLNPNYITNQYLKLILE
jgi:hypothetical protein